MHAVCYMLRLLAFQSIHLECYNGATLARSQSFCTTTKNFVQESMRDSTISDEGTFDSKLYGTGSICDFGNHSTSDGLVTDEAHDLLDAKATDELHLFI